MSTAQLRAIEDYIRLLNRNAMSHAVRAAAHLGILKALESGQRTLEQLAEMLDLKPKPLELLMNVLVESELIEKYDQDYALSTVARLIPSQAYDLGDRYWQYLAGVVRTGVRLPDDDEVPVSERDYLIDMATAEWTNTPVAMDVADFLEFGTQRKALRILELGCGAAVFGAALAHKDPSSHLVLVDEPESIRRAEKTVEGVELEGRSKLVEARYWEEDLATQLDHDTFDMVLMAGILNRHDPEAVHQMLNRYRELLKPDGELAIVDIFPGQEDGNEPRAIFELELFLRTSSGFLQSPIDLQQSLKAIGFRDVQYAHLPSSPHFWGLILARNDGKVS